MDSILSPRGGGVLNRIKVARSRSFGAVAMNPWPQCRENAQMFLPADFLKAPGPFWGWGCPSGTAFWHLLWKTILLCLVLICPAGSVACESHTWLCLKNGKWLRNVCIFVWDFVFENDSVLHFVFPLQKPIGIKIIYQSQTIGKMFYSLGQSYPVGQRLSRSLALQYVYCRKLLYQSWQTLLQEVEPSWRGRH